MTMNGASMTARRLLNEEITERDFQSDVIYLAETLGWTCYHTHDSRSSERGYPDLSMVRGKRHIYAELKRESLARGKLTAAQLAWLVCLDVAGHECYLWRPSSWNQIEEVLK